MFAINVTVFKVKCWKHSIHMIFKDLEWWCWNDKARDDLNEATCLGVKECTCNSVLDIISSLDKREGYIGDGLNNGISRVMLVEAAVKAVFDGVLWSAPASEHDKWAYLRCVMWDVHFCVMKCEHTVVVVVVVTIRTVSRHCGCWHGSRQKLSELVYGGA
mgnify:CR=1 FL=1